MKPPISFDKRLLEDFCRRNHIARLALFGSVLSERFGPDSDLDVLVEFQPGAVVTLLDMVRMECELKELTGRKVDLHTPEDLSRYFRDEVIASAVVQYAEQAG